MRAFASAVAAAVLLAATPALAKKTPEENLEIPMCPQVLGTVAIKDSQNEWWRQYNLGNPAAVIKLIVMKSGCFQLVDRGQGMQMMKEERELMGDDELQRGSDIGKGQMKAADYVLVPDIVNKNANSGGKNVGGIIGGMLGGVAGALAGGISLKSKTADVVLTMTDVRSTEQVSLQQGHAKKTDLGWGAGGGAFFGGFAAGGASSYANTEIGQVVTAAYLDAFVKLIDDVKKIQPDAKADNVQQAVSMAKPGKLFTNPSPSSQSLRDLDAGAMLYPTGEKQGPFWKVQDELGNEGWVAMGLLQLAK